MDHLNFSFESYLDSLEGTEEELDIISQEALHLVNDYSSVLPALEQLQSSILKKGMDRDSAISIMQLIESSLEDHHINTFTPSPSPTKVGVGLEALSSGQKAAGMGILAVLAAFVAKFIAWLIKKATMTADQEQEFEKTLGKLFGAYKAMADTDNIPAVRNKDISDAAEGKDNVISKEAEATKLLRARLVNLKQSYRGTVNFTINNNPNYLKIAVATADATEEAIERINDDLTEFEKMVDILERGQETNRDIGSLGGISAHFGATEKAGNAWASVFGLHYDIKTGEEDFREIRRRVGDMHEKIIPILAKDAASIANRMYIIGLKGFKAPVNSALTSARKDVAKRYERLNHRVAAVIASREDKSNQQGSGRANVVKALRGSIAELNRSLRLTGDMVIAADKFYSDTQSFAKVLASYLKTFLQVKAEAVGRMSPQHYNAVMDLLKTI